VVASGHGRWAVTHGAARHEIRDPMPPPTGRRAEPIGASTAAVLGELTVGAAR